MRLFPLLAFTAAGLAGCGDLGMDRQPRYVAQGAAVSLPNRAVDQEAPAGVVAVGQPEREVQALTPPTISLALLQRGRARYAIACAPCHGASGDGRGSVVARGYPPSPGFSEPHASGLSAPQIYDVISNGYGVMLPQAERVAPADRWAIVAYVRVLDLAQRESGRPAT